MFSRLFLGFPGFLDTILELLGFPEIFFSTENRFLEKLNFSKKRRAVPKITLKSLLIKN